jgi:hypothetical protein
MSSIVVENDLRSRRFQTDLADSLKARHVTYSSSPVYVPYLLSQTKPEELTTFSAHTVFSWRDLFDMSAKLKNYLFDNYRPHDCRYYSQLKKDTSFQIDDQDDGDMLPEFCNIWVSVARRNTLRIELHGMVPINDDMRDLAEIYHGMVDADAGRIALEITLSQIEVLIDLSTIIRKTATSHTSSAKTNWNKISARTISSLYRFVRVIKEYQQIRRSRLVA